MRHFYFGLALALSWVHPSFAMSLRVAPALLDVPPSAMATQLTLRNGSTRPVTVQLRIFRWIQKGGQEILEPTMDVVVSPPMITLPHRDEYVVRVVRVTKLPIVGEENYRLIVDELPELSTRQNGTVSFILRQSIPVFFSSPDIRPAEVNWSVHRSDGNLILSARNVGAKRLRVAKLSLSVPRSVTVSKRDGLVGYVLGGSEMSWVLRSAGGRAQQTKVLQLLAESETGPINATPSFVPAR